MQHQPATFHLCRFDGVITAFTLLLKTTALGTFDLKGMAEVKDDRERRPKYSTTASMLRVGVGERSEIRYECMNWLNVGKERRELVGRGFTGTGPTLPPHRSCGPSDHANGLGLLGLSVSRSILAEHLKSAVLFGQRARTPVRSAATPLRR